MKNTTAKNRIMIIAIAFIMIASFVTMVSANAATEEFTNTDDAASVVLDAINDHESNFTVKFAANSTDGDSIAEEIFDKAVKESGMSDYIEYGVYSKRSFSWTAKGMNGEYHFTINYNITYKMTERQSNSFEKKLDKTVDRMNLDGKSDKAKVKKIYNWITKNVKYDKKSNGNTKYTAYAALNKKKAVCQGYALLFYRMCDEAGVDSKIITGVSHNENHAWNIVKIGNKYKNVDATWDAGKSAKNYKYYLKGDKKFRKDHKRSSTYSTSAFYNAFPTAR